MERQPGIWHGASGWDEPISAPDYLIATHRPSGEAFEAYLYRLDKKSRTGQVGDGYWQIMAFCPLHVGGCRLVDWADPLLWANTQHWELLPWGTPPAAEKSQQLALW
jgi:hypothetical protein